MITLARYEGIDFLFDLSCVLLWCNHAPGQDHVENYNPYWSLSRDILNTKPSPVCEYPQKQTMSWVDKIITKLKESDDSIADILANSFSLHPSC